MTSNEKQTDMQTVAAENTNTLPERILINIILALSGKDNLAQVYEDIRATAERAAV